MVAAKVKTLTSKAGIISSPWNGRRDSSARPNGRFEDVHLSLHARR